MNTRTWLATALAAASLGTPAFAQSVTGEDDTGHRAAIQAEEVEEARMGEAETPPQAPPVERELPPQVNEDALPVDPRVPTAEVEDPMRTMPPPEHGSDRWQDGEAGPHARWKHLDTDGDGRISSAEARADAAFESRFEAMDSDADGYISDGELRLHGDSDQDRRRDRDDHQESAIRR